MYFLFADETNLEPSQGRFFIYGGLIMTPQQMVDAHEAIVDIRSRYGFGDEDAFKFHTRSRPKHIAVSSWTNAKRDAIAAANEIGATLIIYVVLHDIARTKSKETTLEWALNSVVAHFGLRFLEAKNDCGAVCLDRVPEDFGYNYLCRKFQTGVSLPDGRDVKLPRIVHYSISSDGASHISSLVDISLGGMRYAINAAGGAGREPLAREILPPLAQMMWHKNKADGTRQIGGYGFLQYPKEIKSPVYKQEYTELATTLAEWGAGGSQN